MQPSVPSHPSDPSDQSNPAELIEAAPTRRKLLGTMAAAGALLGLNATQSAASAKAAEPAVPAPAPTPDALFAMSRLRDYKSKRSSSWDKTGGNTDSLRVEPGQSATLLEATGAGVITHIWFTINSSDRMHLKNLVLRAWWDGESAPSIEVPVGDF